MTTSAYTGTYYLESNIHITNGATLEIDGEVSGTSGCKVLLLVRVCLNFIRPSWNGWNGTRLFVVVRSIPTCFQVFVSIPTTKKKAGIAANSVRSVTFWTVNINTRYNCDAQAASRMPRAQARTTPTTPFPFSRHDYSEAKTHAVPWGGEGGSGREARQQ